MKQKTFILGVGAQKCGTSWIHDYINSSNSANFGFMKEYHIFDSLYLDTCSYFYKSVENTVLYGLTDHTNQRKYKNAIQRLAFLTNPDQYYAYFTDLIQKDDVFFTGDFTPSYSGLPVEVLSRIKAEFNTRGVRVAPVFIIRDPIARLQSMTRMMLKRGKDNFTGDDEENLIKKLHLSDQDKIRSNYVETLAALQSVFGDDYFVGFYESIFTNEELRKLTDFLSMDYMAPDFEKKINVSRTKNTLSDKTIEELRHGYKPIYDGCVEQFGSEVINNLWSNY